MNRSEADESWLDLVGERFEQAWDKGGRPKIEVELDGVQGPRREVLLRHLLTIELERRYGQGDRPTADEYRGRFAADDERVIADVIDSTITPAREKFGNYELLSEISHGGMGVVYKARHLKLGRICALKLISNQLTTDHRVVDRFKQECKLLGGLNHENIVFATDAGEDAGRLFLVMELVDGGDLATLVKQNGPLAEAEACELIQQAARGLQYAYEKGLVHRDIKPSNLMRSADGRIKILDLGLARALLGPGEDRLLTTSILGTPEYMAPEQCRASHDVTIAADIYSLGCTLFYILDGQPPFPSELYQDRLNVMNAHQSEPVPALRNRVDPGVDDVLRRMLQKDPSQRYATPGEVAQALEPFARSGRSVPRPNAPQVGKGRFEIRTRVPVIAVMGVKGGVGKGTIVSCIAQLLADARHHVAIIDCDIEDFGSTAAARRVFGVENEPVKTVVDHIAPLSARFQSHIGCDNESLWDITPAYLKERDRGRIWLLPACDEENDNLLGSLVPGVPEPKEGPLKEAIEGMIRRVLRVQANVRCILLDCEAGRDVLHAAAFANGTYGYVVVPPDTSHLSKVRTIRKDLRGYYREINLNRVFTVVNQITKGEQEENCKNALRLLELPPPIAFIPKDPTVEEDMAEFGGIDYGLGYNDVFHGVRECLENSLNTDDRALLPDEYTVRYQPWWRTLIRDGVARGVLESPRFRVQTWGTRLLVFTLGIILVQLVFDDIRVIRKATVAAKPTVQDADPVVIDLIPTIVTAVVLACAIAWLLWQESRRRLLKRIANISPAMEDSQRKFFNEILGRRSQLDLRWLNKLKDEAQSHAKGLKPRNLPM